MRVHILTPEKNLFEGQAKAVILPGLDGQFELLEKHAPMISALTKGKIQITEENGNQQSIEITRGFCEVLNNEVNLLVRV